MRKSLYSLVYHTSGRVNKFLDSNVAVFDRHLLLLIPNTRLPAKRSNLATTLRVERSVPSSLSYATRYKTLHDLLKIYQFLNRIHSPRCLHHVGEGAIEEVEEVVEGECLGEVEGPQEVSRKLRLPKKWRSNRAPMPFRSIQYVQWL